MNNTAISKLDIGGIFPKWRKKTVDDGTVTEKYYLGGIEYNGNTLEAIYHREGRAFSLGGGNYEYQYTIKDHLGNSRVMYKVVAGIPTLIQENHYYAFGMELEHSGFVGSTNMYRYNLPAPKFARQAGGKELNDNFGYNLYAYGARWYDPTIGRFIGIDPASDKFTHVTTYNYAENSPILNIDLWGLQKFGVIARAFIPDKKVENPNLLSKIKFFLGDDRGYDPNATSSRAEQSVQLNFDNSSTSTLSNVALPSIGLDKEGNEIARSGVDAAGNVTSKCRDRQGYRGFTKTRDNPGHHSG